MSFRDFFRVSLELGVEDSDEYSLSDHIRHGFVSSSGFGAITLAEEIMTRGIFSIYKNQDLAKVCSIMIAYNVSALVVLDKKGMVFGMISKTDVTRALASML